MKRHRVVLMAAIAINILMNSATYNSFDSYYNAQLDELSVIDESIWDTIRSGVLAAMLPFLPISSRAADKIPEKRTTPIVQVEKTYSGYTEAQATNIIARTLYMEARSEGKEGIDAVASVILNRAGEKAEKMPTVCLKKSQFSCWNGTIAKSPVLYNIIIPKSAKIKGTDQDMWRYCNTVAEKMLSGTFKSTVGKSNAYHAISITPDWDSKLADKITKGSHVFGYLPEYDGSIVVTNPVKKAPKPKPQPTKPPPTTTLTTKYTVRSGDQLGKIALKFNTTTSKLLTLNPKYKNNPNRIKVGDVIIVPGGSNGKRK